jgi:hypothetical protein
MLVWVSAARICEGISSGPSAVWRSRAAGGESGEEIAQILLHIRIGIFLNHQRRRCVADKTGQKPVAIFRRAQMPPPHR